MGFFNFHRFITILLLLLPIITITEADILDPFYGKQFYQLSEWRRSLFYVLGSSLIIFVDALIGENLIHTQDQFRIWFCGYLLSFVLYNLSVILCKEGIFGFVISTFEYIHTYIYI